MPLPVIGADVMERVSIILNGAPLMITGDQSGIASAANPAGLRLAGGSLFRDYTPWTEREFDDWSMGLGHDDMKQNGFLWSEVDTSDGNKIQLLPGTARQSLSSEDTSSAGGWNGYPFWESKIIEASDGKLYSFYGFNIYRYNDTTNTWASWFDIRNTIFHANYIAQREVYIIDLCEFNGHIVIVTTPFFRSTSSKTPPALWTHTLGRPNTTGDYYIQNVYQSSELFTTITPNVFAIRISDSTPFIVGSGGVSGTLPLQYTGPLEVTSIRIGSSVDPSTDEIRDVYNYRGSGACATACFSYGGYLFIGGSAGYQYTSGTPETKVARKGPFITPDTPAYWFFEGIDAIGPENSGSANQIITYNLESDLNLSTRHGESRWVTGFAAMQGDTVGDFYVYMTTTEGLYSCDMALPTLIRVLQYDGENPGNGRGIITHQNDIYIPTYRSASLGANSFPVGGDVIRFTQGGQVVNVGLDQTPVTPNVGVAAAGATTNVTDMASTLQLATAPNMLLAGLYGEDPTLASSHQAPPKIVGLKGQGWHAMVPRHTEAGVSYGVVRGLYYRASNQTLYWNNISSKNSSPAEVEFLRVLLLDVDKATYTRSNGYIWLGYFDAETPLLQKDWHSISLYGDCLDDPAINVDVYWEIVDSIPDCGHVRQTPLPANTYVYATGSVNGEYIIPTTADQCGDGRAGRYISLALRLRTTDTSKGPVIRGIKVKYFVPIDDYFRFNYSVTLPKECLNDLCGDPIEEYVQSDWDEAIREAACSIEPVPFRDIDGKWYLVRIESESRRIDKVDYVGAPEYRKYDITWSLSFVQTHNPSLCDDSWEPICPP